MNRRTPVVFALALVVTLAAAGAVAAQGSRSVFGWVIADRALVQGDLTVAGSSALADVAIAGDVATDSLTLSAATVLTLTSGAIFTPSESFQPVASAGAVGVGLGVCPAGRVTTIVNTVNQAITFTDTTTSKLSGNAVLGQYDTLTLLGDGTNCYEIAQADN